MTGPSNPIENPTPHPALKPPSKPRGQTRDQMAWRVAKDIPGGSYVNLGIGMPELVTLHLPQGRRATTARSSFIPRTASSAWARRRRKERKTST